jgi:NADH-quinone oxidoreductase subunit L
MHAMGNVIDMRRFGGLRTVMPVTHLTFLCGAAALAGVPLLSGFWSKDLILESLQFGAHTSHPYAHSFFLLMLVAMLTAGLTAFYTFRAYFLTFWGPTVVPDEAGHHAHESPGVMTVPLVVLAAGALFVGIIAEPFTHSFSGFVGRTPSIELAARLAGAKEVAHHFNWGVAGVSTLLALGGAALAYMAYGAGGPERVPAPLAGVYAASRNKLYVDELYEAALVKPAEWLAVMARVFDLFLDSLARVVAAVPRFVGVAVRPIQNGLIQFYALSMVLGLAVFLSFVVFRVGR